MQLYKHNWSHSGKVIKVEAEGVNAAVASYDLILFFTAAEISEFADPGTLGMIKVNGNSIDDASHDANNFVVNGGLANAYTEQKYRTYKGTQTGSGMFALVTRETFSTKNIKGNEFKIYPTVLTTDKAITIISNKTAIDRVAIYSTNEVLIKSFKLESSSQAKVAVSELTSGMYSQCSSIRY